MNHHPASSTPLVFRVFPATILVPPGRILLNSLYPDSRHRRRAAKYDGRLWLCEPPAPLTARPRTPSGTGVAVPVASPAGLRGLAWSVENVRLTVPGPVVVSRGRRGGRDDARWATPRTRLPTRVRTELHRLFQRTARRRAHRTASSSTLHAIPCYRQPGNHPIPLAARSPLLPARRPAPEATGSRRRRLTRGLDKQRHNPHGIHWSTRTHALTLHSPQSRVRVLHDESGAGGDEPGSSQGTKPIAVSLRNSLENCTLVSGFTGSLEEKIPLIAARLDSLLQLREDGDDGSEHCSHICVDVELGATERACMHVSSFSSTVLMFGRSSGRCAQHSHVSAGIESLFEGFESCGRSPFKALEAAAAPDNSSKARRS